MKFYNNCFKEKKEKITTQQLLDLGFQPCSLKECYEYHFKNTIFVNEFGEITITNGIVKNIDVFDLAKLINLMVF
jgi:hypothetical protein